MLVDLCLLCTQWGFRKDATVLLAWCLSLWNLCFGALKNWSKMTQSKTSYLIYGKWKVHDKAHGICFKGGWTFFLMLFGWFTIFKHFVILPKSGRGDIVYVEEFDLAIFGILIKGILYLFKIQEYYSLVLWIGCHMDGFLVANIYHFIC